MPEKIFTSRVAVVGMHVSIPGASDLQQFWDLIVNGKTTASSDDLKETYYFDADFFSYSPGEVLQMDPQQRMFLINAYRTLESAGHAGSAGRLKVGVFGSVGINVYLLKNVLHHTSIQELEKDPFAMIGNYADFLATRVGYKLNFQGPCISVQSGCSSSLVALHLAKESLLRSECDLALVGGICLPGSGEVDYSDSANSLVSTKGFSRAFDENSSGAVFTPGCGFVLLRRLDDAVADGDIIYGIVAGSAVNNDGSEKAGFTAPGQYGQEAVLKEALSNAEVSASSIDYIETHGTATALGDLIEFTALKNVYVEVKGKNKIALGTVKNNIGHVDVAAGVVGLIKTCLALKNNILPPMAGFSAPNAKLNIDNSQFYIPKEAAVWPEKNTPRRAGVSAFGLGGTNAHVIVEEYKQQYVKPTAQKCVMVSAKTEAALDGYVQNILTFLPDADIPNLCFSSKVGRRTFDNRAVIHTDVFGSTSVQKGSGFGSFKTVFIFPGQGSQYSHMADRLIENSPLFRMYWDKCLALFREAGNDCRFDDKCINETLYTQPALFSFEYALGMVLLEMGIQPALMIGHSIGEYAAYALSKVFSLEEAVAIVAKRAQLLSSLSGGAMVAVHASCDVLRSELPSEFDIAAINSPTSCTLSGPTEKIDGWLNSCVFPAKKLTTSFSFHSRYVEPILEEFSSFLDKFKLKNPLFPILSNVTGELMDTDSTILVDHLKKTVLFHREIEKAQQMLSRALFIEVGPGRTLTSLLQGVLNQNSHVENLLPHSKEKVDSWFGFEQSLAKLWLRGLSFNWDKIFKGNRIYFPTYPFAMDTFKLSSSQKKLDKKRDVSQWMYEKRLVECKDKVIQEGTTGFALENETFDSFLNKIRHSEKGNDLRLYSTNFVSWDTPVDPNKAMMLAFALVVPQEMPEMKVRLIDAENCESSPAAHPLSVVRGDKKFVYEYVPMTLKSGHIDVKNAVIIGGTGRMGGYYAKALKKLHVPNIILLSRSAKGKKIDDFILEDGDVCDLQGLCTVFDKIEKNIGQIDLIIHAAGIEQTKHMKLLNDVDKLYFNEVMLPKILGLNNLKIIQEKKSIKHVGVVSSISSILGGMGLLVYAASHCYIDAFVLAQKNGWFSVNWDALAVNASTSNEMGGGLDRLAIRDDEAVEVACLTLRHQLENEGSIIVSTTDLKDRYEAWVLGKVEGVEKNLILKKRVSTSRLPNNALEKALQECWQRLLGIEGIGVDENFFDLGGDSLLAMRMVREMAQAGSVKISVSDLFEKPTIALLTQNGKVAGDDLKNRTSKQHQAFNLFKQRAL